MKHRYDYSPASGWHKFDEAEQLIERVWQCCDRANWHYLNFTTGTSIWESKHDGSVIYVAHGNSMIEQVFAESGQAEAVFDPIGAGFRLHKATDANDNTI